MIHLIHLQQFCRISRLDSFSSSLQSIVYKLLAMPMAWVTHMLAPPTFSIGLSLLGALPPNPLFTQQHCHFKYILLILILSFILPYFYYIFNQFSTANSVVKCKNWRVSQIWMQQAEQSVRQYISVSVCAAQWLRVYLPVRQYIYDCKYTIWLWIRQLAYLSICACNTMTKGAAYCTTGYIYLYRVGMEPVVII